MGDTPSDPSVAGFDPCSQASILLGMGTSAREWISLSSTGDLDSTSACLAASTSSFSSTFVLTISWSFRERGREAYKSSLIPFLLAVVAREIGRLSARLCCSELSVSLVLVADLDISLSILSGMGNSAMDFICDSSETLLLWVSSIFCSWTEGSSTQDFTRISLFRDRGSEA